MFASVKFTALLALLAVPAFAAPGTFNPKAPKTEIVDRPQVLAPKAGDVYVKGTQQTVRWDTSSIHPENYNKTGVLLLGYIEGDDYDEHLSPHPLAAGFPIVAGQVDITVPDVLDRDNYIVVLFGDSGNTSPKFTITGNTTTVSASA